MAKAAPPKTLGPGGAKLWRALISDGMPEHLVALLTEACRTRDRLDKLDRILTGDVDTWCELRQNFDGDDTYVYVNDALLKANTTAGVLQNLLGKIPAPAAAAPKAVGASGSNGNPPTPLDKIRADRAARGGSPAKSTRARTAERRRSKSE